MPRFLAQSLRTMIDTGTVLRIWPEEHQKGDPQPVIPIGTELKIGMVTATVLRDSGSELVLDVDGKRLRLTPLTPAEIDLSVSYTEGIGLREWVVRGWA